MVQIFIVTTTDAGRRLDQFLGEQLADVSRSIVRRLIDIGGVHVDGRRARKNGLLVAAGQRIEVHRDRAPLEPFRLLPEHIVFQDAYLLAINKPAGIDTQPTPARYKGTLWEAVQVWLDRDRRFGRRLEIGMVQRLDRDTSGVIVFSIHPRAHGSLSDQFRARQVRKFYLALVSGVPTPPSGVFTSPLVRDRRANRVKTVETGGRHAETRYRVLQEWTSSSLVLVELVTGRTHQIRAHFAAAGYPLLGDVRYGGPAVHEHAASAGHRLHAWRLRLQHPHSGELFTLCAPPPTPMTWPILESVGEDPGMLFGLSS